MLQGPFVLLLRQSVPGGILLLLFIALSHSGFSDESEREYPFAVLKIRTSG